MPRHLSISDELADLAQEQPREVQSALLDALENALERPPGSLPRMGQLELRLVSDMAVGEFEYFVPRQGRWLGGILTYRLTDDEVDVIDVKWPEPLTQFS